MHRRRCNWWNRMSQVQQHDQHIRYQNFHCDQTRAAWWVAVYVGHVLEIVDMQLQAVHEYELALCPNKHQQHAKNRNEQSTAHHGWLDHEDKEKTTIIKQSFQRCCWSVFWHLRRKMSFCGGDKTKHDINSSMKRLGNNTPSSKFHTINNARTTICRNRPPMITIVSFTCHRTIIGKVWISRLLGWTTKRNEYDFGNFFFDSEKTAIVKICADVQMNLSTNWLKTSDDLGGSPHPQDMVAIDRASPWEKQQNFLKFNELNQTSRPCTAGDRQKNAARGRGKKSCSGEKGGGVWRGWRGENLGTGPQKGTGKGDGEETLQRPRERAPQKPPPRPHRGRRCEQFCFLFWRFLETAYCFSWLQLMCMSNAHHWVCNVPSRGLLHISEETWLTLVLDGEDLFPLWKNLFSVLLSTNLVARGNSCVSSNIISNGIPCSVWKVVTSKDWILSLRTVRCVLASPRTVETSFSAAPVLWWLCAGNVLSQNLSVLSFKTTFFWHFVQ